MGKVSKYVNKHYGHLSRREISGKEVIFAGGQRDAEHYAICQHYNQKRKVIKHIHNIHNTFTQKKTEKGPIKDFNNT